MYVHICACLHALIYLATYQVAGLGLVWLSRLAQEERQEVDAMDGCTPRVPNFVLDDCLHVVSPNLVYVHVWSYIYGNPFFIYLSLYLSISLSIYLSIYLYIHTYIDIHIYTHIHTHISTNIYMYKYTCICVYMYTYIDIHVHIHIYTYVWTTACIWFVLMTVLVVCAVLLDATECRSLQGQMHRWKNT